MSKSESQNLLKFNDYTYLGTQVYRESMYQDVVHV